MALPKPIGQTVALHVVAAAEASTAVDTTEAASERDTADARIARIAEGADPDTAALLTRSIAEVDGWPLRGPDLATLRARVGLSQSELGRRVGCSHTMIGVWERGAARIPLDMCRALLETLQTEASEQQAIRLLAARLHVSAAQRARLHHTPQEPE